MRKKSRQLADERSAESTEGIVYNRVAAGKCVDGIIALFGRSVKFETIRNLLLNYGFIETTPGGGSSHYTYHKGTYRVTVVKNKPVNSIYIKQVIKIIDALEEEL